MKPGPCEVPWADCPVPIGWEGTPQAAETGGFASRQTSHRNLERAQAGTTLPERPDHEAAYGFLVMVRREIATPGRVTDTGSVC